MNELDLYKFIYDDEYNGIEIDWRGDELIIWIPFYQLKSFTELVGYDYFSESGMDVNLQFTSIAFDLIPICEYWDIEPTRILEKEEE